MDVVANIHFKEFCLNIITSTILLPEDKLFLINMS